MSVTTLLCKIELSKPKIPNLAIIHHNNYIFEILRNMGDAQSHCHDCADVLSTEM